MTDRKSSPTVKTFTIEGNIGVGKTTLCQKAIAANPQGTVVLKEMVNEKLLSLFYQDPRKYAFAFQLFMMAHRLYNQTTVGIISDGDSHRLPWQHDQKVSVFWDSSVLRDFMFALVNEENGNISTPEMQAYISVLTSDVIQDSFLSQSVDEGGVVESSSSWKERFFGGGGGGDDDVAQKPFSLSSLKMVRDVTVIVFLFDDPAECKRRVEEERQIAAEKGIPLSYYQQLEEMHFRVLLQLWEEQCPKTVVMDWQKYSGTQDPVKLILFTHADQRMPIFARKWITVDGSIMIGWKTIEAVDEPSECELLRPEGDRGMMRTICMPRYQLRPNPRLPDNQNLIHRMYLGEKPRNYLKFVIHCLTRTRLQLVFVAEEL